LYINPFAEDLMYPEAKTQHDWHPFF